MRRAPARSTYVSGWLAALTAAVLALAGCAGGSKELCEPDPSYAGRQDGRELAVPEGLSPPRTTGRFDIPEIAADAAGEVDPRCTAYPPRIAGVEDNSTRERRRREADRRRERDEEAAREAVAMAGGSATNPRELPEPPSTSGAPVGTDTLLYAEVYDLVSAWSSAWESRSLDEYLEAYAIGFQPPQPMTRGEWEETRERRMQEGAQAEVLLETLEVYQGDEGPVARFQEDFEFEGIESEITKELLLVREAGGWRILAERVIDVR